METGVVFVAFDYNKTKRVHVAKLIIEFSSRQFNHQFAVVLRVRDESHVYLDEERQLRMEVKITSKLEGDLGLQVLRDDWENSWVTWKCEDTQLMTVFWYPQQATRTKRITAVASEEEFLSQSVLVLDVDWNWVMPPIKEKGGKS